MNSKAKAVEDIKKFSKMFKGWLDLADELEQVGSLENYVSEVKQRSSEAEKEEKLAVAKLNEIKAELSKVQSECNELKDKASDEAKEIVLLAKSKAEQVEMNAQENAKLLMDASKEEALKYSAQVESLVEQKIALSKEVTEGKRVLAEVTAQIKELKEKFK